MEWGALSAVIAVFILIAAIKGIIRGYHRGV